MQNLYKVKVEDLMGFPDNVIHCTHNGVYIWSGYSTLVVTRVILVSCLYYNVFYIPLTCISVHIRPAYHPTKKVFSLSVQVPWLRHVTPILATSTLPTFLIVGLIQGSFCSGTNCAIMKIVISSFRNRNWDAKVTWGQSGKFSLCLRDHMGLLSSNYLL